MADATEKIKELHSMFKSGMITQEEFDSMKKEVLGSSNQDIINTNSSSNPDKPSDISGQAYTLALATLITGIAGWFLWIPAIAAVITGHMSLKRYKLQVNQEGRGFAVAGLILGWVVLGISILVILLFLLAIPLFFIAI